MRRRGRGLRGAQLLLSESWAPGRVCLLGEHTDWAEVQSPRACLVAPVPQGVWARVYAAPAWSLTSPFGSGPLDLRAPPHPSDPLGLVRAVLRRLGAPDRLPPLHLALEGDLPAGRGLSSSAATAVALVRAVSRVDPAALWAGVEPGSEPEANRIAQVALEAERDGLGVNCGLMDPLACAWGRPLAVRWGPRVQVRALPGGPLPLRVYSFPSPTPAAPILAALRRALDRQEPALLHALRVWGEGALAGADALERGDLAALGARMNAAQEAMEGLPLPELRAPAVERLCRDWRATGALGAKFSGAGGERSAVAVVEPGA